MFRALPIVLLFACALPGSDHGPRRPHIVVILADDLGQGDLGCYNRDSKIPTPHMDRLAAEGTRFTDAHSPSAVCSPTRYGLLTGRYAWRTRLKSGVLNGRSRALIEEGRPTIASVLGERGYQSHVVGKWHLGLGDKQPTDYSKPLTPGPLEVGFDHAFLFPASLDMEPYVYVVDHDAVSAPTEDIKGSAHRRQKGGGFWREGKASPGWDMHAVLPKLAEEACARITAHAERSEEDSLFLYLPLTAPHTPWLPTEEWSGKTSISHYGDFVAQVDGVVGQVMSALEKSGMAENTLLVVTSDNGSHWPISDIERWGHDANNGLRGQKADIHEGGHRIPFLVRWSDRVPSGEESDELICLTDLYATIAAITGGVPETGGEDSFDLSALLLGERADKPVRDQIVHHSLRGMFAIRQGPWKLIMERGSGGFTRPASVKPKEDEPTGQLYNLKRDPAETQNVWEDNPEVVARLGALLQDLKESGHSKAPR
jgi:arylsulfatase A-like enzyme